MMMSVNERVQEIDILLSIGTGKGEVRRMFVYEAFIPGIVGGVVGISQFLITHFTQEADLLVSSPWQPGHFLYSLR